VRILYLIGEWQRNDISRITSGHINGLLGLGHDVMYHVVNFSRPRWLHLDGNSIGLERAREHAWDAVVACDWRLISVATDVPAKRRVFLANSWPPDQYERNSPEFTMAMSALYTLVVDGFGVIVTDPWIKKPLSGLGRLNTVTIGAAADAGIYRLGNIGPSMNDYIAVDADGDTDKIAVDAAIYLSEALGLTTPIVVFGNSDDVLSYPGTQPVLRPLHADLRRIYSGARMFIKAHPGGGCSLSPLESLTCGTPVLLAVDRGDSLAQRYSNAVAACRYRSNELSDTIGWLASSPIAMGRLINGALAIKPDDLCQWSDVAEAIELWLS